ncbi:unnamed protein product [Effrenium voratum]|uniref:Uncharacterized protein n=1 Tax=Effrenium voratum TaxID=2562239 RepID=A0AA36J1G1_9DINO|nr:unnamed protein product [Effrenium voratum]CAJ1431122.1 unnamed protein product [Effrenium voratum]
MSFAYRDSPPGYPPLEDPYAYSYGPGYANSSYPPNRGPLTVVANASVLSGESQYYHWYRVAFLGGIELRQSPNIDAPRVGTMLEQNATFAASEEFPGPDGRIYLRLADGRGWAFDDSAIYPNDPVVVRGFWSPIGPGTMPAAPPEPNLAALQLGGIGARGPLDRPPSTAPYYGGLGPPPGHLPPGAHPPGSLDAAPGGTPWVLDLGNGALPGEPRREFDRAPGGLGLFP